jgi:hypothetical protein
MNLHRQPDDPGASLCDLLSFKTSLAGRCLVFMGDQQIGDIVQASWLRATIYSVTIHLGTRPRRISANTLAQAKVFALQEVAEFFARTPVRLELREARDA